MTSEDSPSPFDHAEATLQLFRHLVALDLLTKDLGESISDKEMDVAQDESERFVEMLIASLNAAVVGPADEPNHVLVRVRLLDIDPLLEWLDEYEAAFET